MAHGLLPNLKEKQDGLSMSFTMANQSRLYIEGLMVKFYNRMTALTIYKNIKSYHHEKSTIYNTRVKSNT